MVDIFHRALPAESSRPQAPRLLRRPFARMAVTVAMVLIIAAFALPALAQKGVSISFLSDPAASMTIEEAAAPAKARDYNVYVPSFMAFSRLAGDFNGAIWLRFSMGPAFEKPAGTLQVNLGATLPGVTRLFIPQKSGTMKMLDAPPPSGVFVIPDETPLPELFYARLDGMPSLWFRPALEIAPNGAATVPLLQILAGVFGLALLLMLIQYVRKGDQWRLWGALTAGCGIAAALIPPMPAATMAFEPLPAAGLALPGVITLFFAHTTRHYFATPKTLPGYDKLLCFYYIIGAALALIPLAPGFLWTARYLPLLPLALVPLLPLGMAALARSLKGGMLFFSACLLAIAGVAASAWELTSTTAAYLGGSGALWGFALGMTLLSLAGDTRQINDEPQTTEDVFDSLDRTAAPEAAPRSAGEDSLTLVEAPAAAPRSLPPLQPASPARVAEEDDFPSLSLFMEREDPTPPAPPQAQAPAQSPVPPATAQPAAEKPAAAPLTLGRPTAAPDQANPLALAEPPAPAEKPLPAPAMPRPAAPGAAPLAAPVTPAPATSVITDDSPDIPAEMPAPHDHTLPATPLGHGHKSLFDLPLLTKAVYDSLAPLAEQKNVGLSWFIVPQTGLLFEGEADLLESALRLLLRDMLEAADKGSVRLNIRRLPDSGDAGHIVFTLVRSDARQTAHTRNMAGLAEAWSLAEKTGGIFSVEHSPSGTTVIFSAMLTAMDAPEEKPARQDTPSGSTRVQPFHKHPDIALPRGREALPPLAPQAVVPADALDGAEEGVRSPSRIIVLDATSSGRARTVAALAQSPYAVLQCASSVAALELYTRHPAALVIMNGAMPEQDIAETLRAFHTNDTARSRTPVKSLILVEDPQQADRMMNSGATRTLPKPVMPETLLHVTKELAPIPSVTKEASPPAPKAEAAPATPVRATAPSAPATPVRATAPSAPATPVRATAPSAPATPAAPTRAQAASPAPTTPSAPTTTRTQATPSACEEGPALTRPTAVSHGPVPTVTPPMPADKTPNAPAPTIVVPPKIMALANAPKPHEPVRQQPAPARSTPAAAPRKAPAAPAPEAMLGKALANPPSAEAGARTAAGAPGPDITESAIFTTALAAQPGPAAAPKSSGPTLGLLDMIVAEESANEAGATPAPSHPAPASAPPRQKKEDETSLVYEESAQKMGFSQNGQNSIPLPGEDDSIYKDMIPLIPGLVHDMSDALVDILRGREEKDTSLMLRGAGRIAQKSGSFGMSKLERMARCVERAAAANDRESTECILADLEEWTSRYKVALVTLHRTMPW